MPSQSVDCKCLACTGPLRFNEASGKFECDYCGSSYNIAEIEAMYAKKEHTVQQAQAEEKAAEGDAEWDMSGMSSDWSEDGAGMRAYSCPSCDAEFICYTATEARCPYCGNPAVVPGHFSGTMKPDCIITFKLGREEAKATLRNYYKGKLFLPKKFHSENKIDRIQGVYVPLWLFDGTVAASADFEATRTQISREGDYQVTETKHYAVRRAGTAAFEGIPANASSKMTDAHMAAIEPFDYSELRPFSTADLHGFLIDRSGMSIESCGEMEAKCAKNAAVNTMREDVKGYTTYNMIRHEARLQQGKVRCALLPVYMLHTKWKGQDCLFAMNGQTGKFIGDLPISKGKYWAWFCGIATGLTVVLGTMISAFISGLPAILDKVSQGPLNLSLLEKIFSNLFT